jgi:HlyD family type I secretion membrane fusion protein
MHATPKTSLGLPILLGGLTITAFFGGLGGWAATAPLAGAAVASATVVPDGSRRTVQHLEGGIVRKILVKDGDQVTAGQPLIKLDPTQSASQVGALRVQRWGHLAAEARLLAEQAEAKGISFPEELLVAAAGEPALQAVLDAEGQRFRSRAVALADQEAILREKIKQAMAEIDGHEASVRSTDRQLALVKEETSGIESLLAKGLERKPRLLALQRSAAQFDGAKAGAWADIARARQMIAEAEQQIRALYSERAETAANELSEIRRGLANLDEELSAASDRLARTTVLAPLAGTVLGLKVKTEGGVVAPGAAILDLVPADDGLLLEARVHPNDIDEIHIGLKAQIHLLAYKSRNMPRIEGEVQEVSADRFTDPQTAEAYFTARILVDPAALPAGVHLAPGMPAEALIVTGERTLLSYLLAPVHDALRRGLRES